MNTADIQHYLATPAAADVSADLAASILRPGDHIGGLVAIAQIEGAAQPAMSGASMTRHRDKISHSRYSARTAAFHPNGRANAFAPRPVY